MPLITWNASFSVHIAELDLQHQKLIGLINELHQSMLHGTARESMGRIITELLDYAGRHFATEERLFNQFGYPEAKEHLQDHAAFLAKVSEFKNMLETRQLSLSISVMQYLYGWANKHILGTDQKYSSFLTSKGVK